MSNGFWSDALAVEADRGFGAFDTEQVLVEGGVTSSELGDNG